MRRQIIKREIVVLLILILSVVGCGPAQKSMDEPSVTQGEDLFKVSLDDSLLSAAQVYASMSELTGVVPDNNTITEWNNARTALPDNYKVAAMSAPLLVATANLGSRFCNQTLDAEVGKVLAERRLYKDVDFSKGLNMLTDAEFNNTVKNIGNIFWGRAISDVELGLFNTFRAEFFAELRTNERTAANKTRALMLGVCTAMLGSFDSLSL